MIPAIVMACGIWAVVWMLGKRLTSGWGVLLPCALMPLLAMTHMTLDQLRVLVVVAMLVTLGMLFHRTLRHYMLLPSFMALAGGLASGKRRADAAPAAGLGPSVPGSEGRLRS